MSPMSTNEHDGRQRCDWCGEHPLYVQYHDEDWGEPVHDDRLLFEFLILEGAQAGLSWLTILKKRAHYRRVYDGFEPAIVATYDDRKVAALLDDAGIVRNRLKVGASISNAQAYLAVQAEFGSFDRYIWQFVEGVPIQNRFKTMQDIPATTPLSDAISKDLKRRGFRFVGSTICYAFMQAVGMVNDHLTTCYRHAELASPRES
jgi:DNA-3-methyladenine glycosylase I